MQQLAQVRIIRGVRLVMAQRRHELPLVPSRRSCGARKLCPVDVYHRRVGRAQFIHMPQRLGVKFLRDLQPRAARFRQPDHFLQPVRPRGFHMHTRVEPS